MGHIEVKELKTAPVFRKMAMGSWQTAGDPSVYGLLEIDMTSALQYMGEIEKKQGVKITPGHMVGKAIAQVLKKRPEINGFISFSKIFERQSVDLFYQVNIPGEDPDPIRKATLSGTVIRNAEGLSVWEIARQLKEKAHKVRTHQDPENESALKMMRLVPWILMRWVLNITSFFNYDLNLDLRWLGIPSDPFGSVMITNVGSLGIEFAWAPLIPYTRVPLLLSLGKIHERPIVIEGKIVARPILYIGVTFDHRMMDGVHAAMMSQHFKECFENPWKMFQA